MSSVVRRRAENTTSLQQLACTRTRMRARPHEQMQTRAHTHTHTHTHTQSLAIMRITPHHTTPHHTTPQHNTPRRNTHHTQRDTTTHHTTLPVWNVLQMSGVYPTVWLSPTVWCCLQQSEFFSKSPAEFLEKSRLLSKSLYFSIKI